MRTLTFTMSMLLSATTLLGANDGLLLRYSFDEGNGDQVRDLSGNGLDGSVRAEWTDSPSGHAVRMDGTSGCIVTVNVPEALRFGTSSWSLTAWIKPTRLSIDDRQNQRRLFAFGKYPAAYLVIDLSADGNLLCYFCYTDGKGRIVSTGATSTHRVPSNTWSQVAVVCDRDTGHVRPYVNGYCGKPFFIRDGFEGDYRLGGTLTLGSGWHNYWGVLDEVSIYRRALTEDEVESEFERRKETFAVTESDEAVEARKRDRLSEQCNRAAAAWARKDFGAVRSCFRPIVEDAGMPPQFRSYAHLRIAQSYLAEGNTAAAEAEYETIQAAADYPAVHRFEASESLHELARSEQGLPARDPAASRVRVEPIAAFAAECFVSPDGDDSGDGSAKHPFATLARARDAVREIKAGGVNGPIAVTIMPGEYRVTETIELGKNDSGAPGAPVVYRAQRRGEAILYGGRRLSGFEPVTDAGILKRLPAEARGKVMQCDLRAQGITDYGTLRVRGFAQPPAPPTLELYVNGKPMTLARWPNEGFVGIRKLVEPGSKAEGKPSVFEYASDRPERWTEAKDPWLFGYFHFLWADASLPVGKIDHEARTITTAQPYNYNGRGMSTQQGIQYYVYNLLEEIDLPGEWYLDRETGVLYFYPPQDAGQTTVEIGMLAVPMVTVDGASDIRFEGLSFDLGRYNGLVLRDCTRCLVAGCAVSRMAGNGIMIHGGTEDGLLGCDVHTVGRRATEVIGGDRKTLTPGKHFVENCRIHFFGRIDRTYTPAIQLEGVGHRVAHNLMYDCPSSVMRIEGNDHVIEFNEVHDAVQESDDQGAMELYRNATYRGVVFRYNTFRDIGKTGTGTFVHGQAGIRFDDAISGLLVYGNIFVRSANGHFGGVQLNSGRDNVIDNNLFVDCRQGISGGWRAGNSVWQMLEEGKWPANFYRNELYLSRYPAIEHMLEAPGIDHIWRNVFYRCGPMTTGGRAHLDLVGNGRFPVTNPGFIDPDNNDYRIRQDAPLFETVGFKPIPVEEIGLYEDEYRGN